MKITAERTCRPQLGTLAAAAHASPDTRPAAAFSSLVAPADVSEIIRLHDAGMGLDALGAKFRPIPYDQLARIIAAELGRRLCVPRV